VVYRVNGPYRMQNTGLSFYYPLDMSEDSLKHYMAGVSGEETELVQVEVDTFTVTQDTAFANQKLADGMFFYFFEMTDARGDYAFSAGVSFKSEDGEIYVMVDGAPAEDARGDSVYA